MNIKDQLLRAGDLGKAAFQAGKPCLPVKDNTFMEFLRACDNRRVGTASVGQAPSLVLVMVWMRCWQTEEQQAEGLTTWPMAAPLSSVFEHADASV